jgi:hypothetical protein
MKSSYAITAIGIALLAVSSIGSIQAHAGQAHSVVVGSPDGVIYTTGGDGNFSLTARVDKDGNVTGQWQDAFTRNPGFHVTVTCLLVEGNTAWISGVVTQASDNTLIGAPAITKVVDNTKNGKGDTISFTFICPPVCTDPVFCTDKPAFLEQFSIIAGNVVVK